MPTKKISATYLGHEFVVINSWFGGMKFFHNDELLEHHKGKFAVDKNKPVMSHFVSIDDVDRFVEVYVYAILSVKIQIRVDGEKIGGDQF